MNGPSVAGGVLTALGLVAYVAGVMDPYPGRAFAITAVMVGLTLMAVSRGWSA